MSQRLEQNGRQRSKTWWAMFKVVSVLTSMGILCAGAGLWALTSHYGPTVPRFDGLEDYRPKVGTRLYSADNQLIAEFAAERRVLISVDEIPKRLFFAFVAAEDKRFFRHGGLDFLGIVQAVFDKIRRPESKLRGASTITQQVAKSLLVSTEGYASATARSIERKIREAILAYHLEQVLSKDEILYMYANQIFLGHKAYGVQAAAEHYFRKNVWELSLAEMATLAGLPQRPSDYSPVSRPEAAWARRRYVLRRMLDDGYITQSEADEAAKEELVVYPRRELYLRIAPYFSEHVRRILIDQYGERAILEDGFHVYTTLNVEWQRHAQNALGNGLYALDKRQGFRGPLARLSEAQRVLFKQKYREQLGVEAEERLTFHQGNSYLAVVTGFKDRGRQVLVDVAGEPGILPLAGMRWAREPNATQHWSYHALSDARDAVLVGDVVSVELTSRKELESDTHGSELIKYVPKKAKSLFRLVQEPVANAALMSADPRTGYVAAMVGGYHFESSSFNRATQACREPGSAFKPVVYSAAIDKLDYTPSTLIDDKPIIFDDPSAQMRWKPRNAGNRFRGQLPMRTCLQDSINTPAIRIANAVGIDSIMKNAQRLGMTTSLKRELGTALGSSCTTLRDLINVYVTLNRGGVRKDLKFVRRVVDRDGVVLEEDHDPSDLTIRFGIQLDRAYAQFVAPVRRVLDEPTSYVMTSLLQNVVESGTARRASELGVPVAGKTGTTNDSYDAWFMGYTRNLVTGVWVGHDKKERPLGVSEFGGRTALPIWVDYVGKVLRDHRLADKPMRDGEGFEPPVGVVSVSIDPETGLLARPEVTTAVTEYYRAGTEPTDYTPDNEFLNPAEMDVFAVDIPL